MQTDNAQPFDEGVHQANAEANGADPEAEKREYADVRKWLKAIADARKFDENARKGYALNRRYARAERTKFEVTVPIALSYIDVLRSFLYAKNPDCDVTPSGFTQPPPQKDITAMVAEKMRAGQTPAAPQLPPSIAKLLGTQGGQPQSLGMPGAPAPGAETQLPTPPTMTGDDDDSQIQQAVAEILKPYQRLRDDAKQLAQTLELTISHVWKKAKLKAQAKPFVGSALTVSIGWLKAAWLERMGRDPVMQGQINDLHEKLARLAVTKDQLDEGNGDADQLKAEIEQQVRGLEEQAQIVVARGMAIDFVAAEDIQVSTDCRDLSAYLDASWIAHRAFISLSQAQTDYPDIKEKLAHATPYYPQKPRDLSEVRSPDGGFEKNVDAAEADSYRKGGEGGSSTLDVSGESYVCVWEAWDRANGQVLTLIEGVECYAKAPYTPEPATSRFYPFFQFQIGNVDGERHGRSLITRSEKLFDEYDRTRSAFAEHRRRVKPKTGFDATNLSETEVSKIEAGGTQEMIPLKPTRPGTPIGDMLQTITYAQIDEKLYDTSPIRAELEMIWGVQEALSSSIQTAKTLGEAEIQQQGTQSRIGYMREGLDDTMGDLSIYTGEILLQKLSVEDVRQIAGPWALWPEGMTIDDMDALVTVSIHAGSTGKPDTTAQRQAWSSILPILQNAIEQIGRLRGSSPDEMADCIEELVVETVNRTGDRIDASRFLPDPPRTPPPPPPKGPAQPLDESALSGPQIQQLLSILVDVRSRAVASEAAKFLIMACAPSIPSTLVDGMVNASLPQPGDGATQIDAPHAQPVPPAPIPTPAGAPAPAIAGDA